MLFNSFAFLVFLPLIFLLHWFVFSKNGTYQNAILFGASLFFYGYWDYRFLLLLLFSTILGYYTGIQISAANTEKKKKRWLWSNILISLGILGFFKYYNFFAVSFTELLGGLGVTVTPFTVNVILPLGISFYTFHGLSYVLDIYNGKVRETRNFIEYGLFVSFFPLLVAGPIERAAHLLPQVQKKRFFDPLLAADGLKQMLWGFFKKAVIADNCALYANMVFHSQTNHSGSTIFLAAIIFTIQIYCDFSGYSDIALGTARLFGIELFKNFNFPFFSKNISEFWQRWHISLTSLATEYLFTPLSIRFRNLGKWGLQLAILINFTIIGFWHGANWTFVLFGLVHGCYFAPLILRKKKKKSLTMPMPQVFSMLGTFVLVALAFIIFRADNVEDAIHYFAGIFSRTFFSIPENFPFLTLILIIFLLTIEWFGKDGEYGIQTLFKKFPVWIRWSFYYFLLYFIHKYFDTGLNFIYFQF